MDKNIEIIEVGPRDGFQNVSEYIPVIQKMKIIGDIVASGIKNIQITSFVSPKAIPQMKDAKEIAEKCLQLYPQVNLSALVPNLKGAKDAVESGIKEIAYVISLSKTHNMRNVRKTHDQSFGELEEIFNRYREIKIILDVSTAFGCPFEGKNNNGEINEFINKAYRIGVRTFNLCDTVGLANPNDIKEVIVNAFNSFPDCEFQVHIHDTRNMGMLNSFIAIENGVSKVQTSIGGLGGCPFAPGASGNTSSEDLVYMLNEMEFNTGVNFNKLLEVAKHTKSIVDGSFSGHHIDIDTSKVKIQ